MQTVPYPTRNCGIHHIRLQTLAADQYLNSHNQVAAQLHLDIYKNYDIKVEAKHWNQHNPERITENDKATILWDFQIITDRHVPCQQTRHSHAGEED